MRCLEGLGFTVDRISQRGVPDLLCSRAGVWYVIEVKSHPELGKRGKPLQKGGLRPDQAAFRDRHRASIPILRDAAGAVAWAKGR